jgi:predicted AlkP superfamily pyrophosphatase or phosphodiesterase
MVADRIPASAVRLVAMLLLALAGPVSAAPGTVIWISLDGVRHDYLARDELPAFARIARDGAVAERLVPVFPSSTFPSHVSMATCARVDRHGMVGNRFRDRERGDFSYGSDASWIDAEPLWIAAERQGVRAATFFWVGSETDWNGSGSTYRKAPFDSGIPESEKVDQILAWLDLPEDRRPSLIMSWWHGADTEGHRNGPEHEDTRAALRAQDAELGRLLAGLDSRAVWGDTTLLLVSDHGMASVTELFDPASFLAQQGIKARMLGGGGFANLYLEDPAQAAAAAEALSSEPRLRAWPGGSLPAELRYSYAARVGDVFVVAEPPRGLTTRWSVNGVYARIAHTLGNEVGSHGYLPEHPDMSSIFLGMGRGVPGGMKLGRVDSLDVAPTVARLLGIEPPEHCEGTPIPGLGIAAGGE